MAFRRVGFSIWTQVELLNATGVLSHVERVELCFVVFCRVLLCFVVFCRVLSRFVMFCHVLPCSVMFCRGSLCSVVLCHVFLCLISRICVAYARIQFTTVPSIHQGTRTRPALPP